MRHWIPTSLLVSAVLFSASAPCQAGSLVVLEDRSLRLTDQDRFFIGLGIRRDFFRRHSSLPAETPAVVPIVTGPAREEAQLDAAIERLGRLIRDEEAKR